jgi:cytochrome c556
MNRQFVIVLIVIAGVFAAATTFAQAHRPYNEVMKDIGATFANLKKNLDANTAPGAVEDAANLEGLFKETEAFWTPFNTKDAINFATTARDAAVAVGAAAKNNDIKAAQASYAGIQKTCGGCHFSHREETGKGFIIKP